MTPRLLVLGLDGAGFQFVADLVEQDRLPNIKSLVEAGCFRPLRSTTPPITGPSWLGLVSGLDVDQTGIADFLVPRSALLDLRPLSSADFRGLSLWDHVSTAGGRVAVFNFPVLYPPYPVNGLMVSGFGTDESTQWTFPDSLKADLLREAGPGYNLSVNYHHEIYNDANRFLDDLEASLNQRLRAAEYCCRREPWDLFFAVLSETDWLLHRCWSDLDPSHPLYNPETSPRIAERARRIWRTIDEWIPRLMDAMGQGASILICSDHGFGPNTSTIRINLLLEQAGLLTRRAPQNRSSAQLRHLGSQAVRKLGAAAARVGGPAGRALSGVRRRARRYLPKDDSAFLSAVIDHDHSLAFDPGHTIPFGGIYIAPRIEPGTADHASAIDRVTQCLDQFAARHDIDIQVVRPSAPGSSPAHRLPDLIVSAGGWGTTFSKTDFSGSPFARACFSPRHTGSHRMQGLLLGAGPAFGQSRARTEASILDLAPSILAVFGIRPPPGRRGRLLDALVAAGDARHSATDSHTPRQPGNSGDDEADVRERLRGLGYIE